MMVSHSLSGVGITDCGLSDVEMDRRDHACTADGMHDRRMCGRRWQVWSSFVMWICAFLCTLTAHYFRVLRLEGRSRIHNLNVFALTMDGCVYSNGRALADKYSLDVFPLLRMRSQVLDRR